MNTYVLDRQGDQIFSCLLDENGRALEIHEDPVHEDVQIGNIYIGQVTRVLKELEAAFVDICPGVSGYLPLKDPLPKILSGGSVVTPGSWLLVQIMREPIKSKQMVLTGQLCLQGQLCVTAWHGSDNGVSRRIPSPRREELKELRASLQKDNYSLLLRTNAGSADDAQIRREAEQQINILSDLLNKSETRTVFSCLYSQPIQYLKRLQSLSVSSTQKITVQDPDLYKKVQRYLKEFLPDLLPRLFRYEDSLLPLRVCYNLTRERERAAAPVVHLKSGANLVIEATEALTVIDVNTSKNTSRLKNSEKEKYFLQTNIEAAREAARQIRLRNLSGIILIDFINMQQDLSYQELARNLCAFLESDPVHTVFIDFTGLGLAEITRKKIEKPLNAAPAFV